MGSITEEYIRGLAQLEMISDEPYSLGLISTSELDKIDSHINYNQRFHLERAKKVDADAIYFRNYPNEIRPSVPQLYIFDFTIKERDIIQIHKNVWSSSEVRLYIVITKTEIRLYNASKPIQFNDETGFKVTPFEILKNAGDAVDKYQLYSAKKFDNGTFWDETKIDFGYSTTSYEKLISELKNARKTFLREINLDKQVASKLLVLGILVKYLEERVDYDDHGNESRVFTADFFNKKEFGNSSDFIDVIRKGYIVYLFDYLSNHFNGKIFFLPDDYKTQLNNADLEPLANFLSGDIDNQQYVIWKLYSFNYLPIELISCIYEMFLEADKSSGIAYTPSYLVNFMIDECMPLHSPKLDYKILDPACGSGIFLVSAYKRLIDWWRIIQFKESGLWKKPGKEHLDQLKKILKDNIYGIDIKGEAVDLAIFSLSLALCDVFSPKVIWDHLRLDDLSNNVVQSDFFEWEGKSNEEAFDLVIGNPPFIEYGKTHKGINEIAKMLEVQVPNNQSALHFTIQGVNLIKKENGLLAFVLPSGPLLYNNSSIPIKFRKWLFSNYNIPQIIDFTYLSKVLFKNKGNEKNVAVSTFFLENKKPDDKPIYHVTVKKLKSAKERQYFEIDHYDFHKVNKNSALNDTFVWKSNLLGGGRLTPFIEKISNFQTLKDFLDSRKERGWVYGDGIIEGKKADDEITQEDLEKKRYKPAEFLTGQKIFNPDDFDENGIHKVFICERKYFQRSRNTHKSIFKSPHLLLKKNIGTNSIPCLLDENNLLFKNEVVGLYCPQRDLECLISILNRIKGNPLYRFFVLSTSARSGVSRSTKTTLQKDILGIPFPENESDIKLSEYENILIEDTLNYGLEFLGKDTNIKVLNTATDNEIKEFGYVLCKILNSLFQEGNKSYCLENIYRTESFIGVSIFYTDENIHSVNILQEKESENSLAQLIINKTNTSYRINRIVKFYDGNRIYLLKPKELIYWLKSVALRDADETIVDLYNAGY